MIRIRGRRWLEPGIDYDPDFREAQKVAAQSYECPNGHQMDEFLGRKALKTLEIATETWKMTETGSVSEVHHPAGGLSEVLKSSCLAVW